MLEHSPYSLAPRPPWLEFRFELRAAPTAVRLRVGRDDVQWECLSCGQIVALEGAERWSLETTIMHAKVAACRHCATAHGSLPATAIIRSV
jgi:hypothetical protein